MTDPFSGYAKHYERVLNTIPDWTAAELEPSKWACRRPWLPANRQARVLDFGCGWGRQLLELWCAGFRNLEGVELDQSQHEVAVRAAGGRVPIACMDGRQFLAGKAGRFDLVILNDVLEHIPVGEQVAMLLAVKEALAAGGTLVVRVPNASSLASDFSRYSDITHTSAFSEFSLMQIFDVTGYVDHAFVPDDLEVTFQGWRPWRPWGGLAIRPRLNRWLHLLVYALRGQQPRPTVFGYNVEAYTRKP